MTFAEETLVQRINAVRDVYPESRQSMAALVFRVLLLYGANARMGSEESVGLPDPVFIVKVAREIEEGRT